MQSLFILCYGVLSLFKASFLLIWCVCLHCRFELLFLFPCGHLDCWNWIIRRLFFSLISFALQQQWRYIHYPIKIIHFCGHLGKYFVTLILDTLFFWVPVSVCCSHPSCRFKPFWDSHHFVPNCWENLQRRYGRMWKSLHGQMILLISEL